MESNADVMKNSIKNNNEIQVIELLNTGFDPNFGGGLPIRMAARYGCNLIVKALVQFGANPHIYSSAGASTLQLAVYSGKNWSGDEWDFLLSCYDSSQLADGAAVAIIFQNNSAFEKILKTGRCNMNIPTTLTGKTVEQLAKGYKVQHLISSSHVNNQRATPTNSPRSTSGYQLESRNTLTPRPHQAHRNLSPSVARFFNQTANQTSLTSPINNTMILSPTHSRILT